MVSGHTAGAELVVAGICWYRKVVTGSGLVAAGAELATELFFCAVFFLEFVHNSTQHSSIVSLKSHAANKTSSLNLRVYVMSVTKVIGSMNFKRGRCGLCSITC